MAAGRSGVTRTAAALLALLLLSFATVQSSVMRAAMPGGAMPPCEGGAAGPAGAMAGMAMPGRPARQDAPASRGRHAACPYCAAAAHPPLASLGPPLRTAGDFSFAAYQRVASHGPRGPPSIQPRARGPPSPLPVRT